MFVFPSIEITSFIASNRIEWDPATEIEAGFDEHFKCLACCQVPGVSIPKCSSSLFSQDLKQKFKNQVEGITNSIWEGTKVMKRMSENIKNRDFGKFSPDDEKNMIFWLRVQFSAFSSKFSESQNLFEGMYRDFQTEHLQAKSILEGKRRELADVSGDLDSLETRVERLENQKRDAGHNLNQAREKYDYAKTRAWNAEVQYRKAREEEEYWETVCYATIWIPFANIGTCVKYHVEWENAKTDYYRKTNELSRAKTKLRTVQEFLTQYNDLKTKLNENKNRKSVLQTTAATLQRKINMREPLLQNFGELQGRIQLFKTEVDLIQVRSQSAQGSHSTFIK